MRRLAGRWLLPLLVGLLATAGAVGCTRAVAGAPAAAPPHAFPVTAPPVRAPAPPVPAPAPPVTATPPSAPPTGPSGLEADVLADECLLDTRRLAALLGGPVRPPEQGLVRRDDGSRSSACYAAATAADGAPAPSAAINVYRVRAGPPARFVRAAGGRALTGAGAAAAVLDTPAGPSLQVAGPRYLVSITVQGREPDDAAWRAAARAALARLPR